MITFAQGSLGYLCNFIFDDHKQVIDNLMRQLTQDSNELGMDERIRLKVSMGGEHDKK